MKKFTTLFSLFAIAISLTLSSCVDDKESDSVIKIRDGYANQLNALSSMYQAYGEADLIRAKAEAALNEAEARIKNALAEQNELDLEIAKATLDLDIEAALLEAETARYQALADLYEAEIKYQRAKDDADAEYLGGLVEDYRDAVEALVNLQNSLVSSKATLLGLKYDVTEAEIVKETAINNFKKTIATQTALLDTYNGLNGTSKEDARIASEAADNTLKALQEKQKTQTAAKTIAQNGVNNAIKAVEDTEYYVAAQTFSWAVIKEDEIVSKSYTLEGQYIVNTKIVEVIKYLDQTVLTENLNSKKKALADTKDALTTAKADLVTAQQALATAYAAYAADPTDAVKQMDYNNAQTDANIAKQDVVDAEEAVAAAEIDLAVAQQQSDALSVTAKVKAYEEAIAALKTAYIALIDAEIALDITAKDIAVQQTLKTQLTSVYNNYTDFTTLIDNCKKAINTAEKSIESYTGVTSKEGLVAIEEQNIKALEIEIAAKEIEAKALKALIDAAM